MRTVRWRTVLAALLPAAALVLPAAAPSAPAIAAAAVPAGPLGGGSCSYHPVNGGYQWVCTDTSTSGGSQGSGAAGTGSTAAPTCTLSPLTQQQAAVLGLPAPPAGHAWDLVGCGGPNPFVGTMLVATGGPAGAPAVTPAELAQIAVGDLIIPSLDPATAPPAGKDGLVGLPEWFWVPPADWHAVQTPPVRAGAVWAIATATPESIVINPGPGLASVPCKNAGVPYNPDLPLSQQQTDCSYTYSQPSAGQPGNAYAASVTVLWDVSWFGSGGTGAPVVTDRPVTTPMTVPVAAGEALVTGQ
jgi:hypothetical protein